MAPDTPSTVCTTCSGITGRIRKAEFIVWDETGLGWYECADCESNPNKERVSGTRPVISERLSLFRLHLAMREQDREREELAEQDKAFEDALRLASGSDR